MNIRRIRHGLAVGTILVSIAAAAETPPLAVAPFDAAQARAHQEAWAKHLGQPVFVTNSIGMPFALIPPGEFTMGSPEAEAGRDPAGETRHPARLTKPFYLATFEVTQDEFDRMMGYNPSYRAARLARTKQNYDVDTSRFPVERVSWFETQEFCKRLSELPAEKAAGREYRLATETEWEYACRAGTTTVFPFGDVLDGTQANINGNAPYGTEKRGPSINRPATVGSYPANAFGLYDMIGNKWEWVADWFARDGYIMAPVENPTGPAEGRERVIRGGAWRYPGAFCRSAVRHMYDPRIRAYDLGFRIALTMPRVPAPIAAPRAPAAPPTAAAPAQAVNREKPTKGAGWVSPATGAEWVWVETLGIWVGKYETTNGEFRKMKPEHNSGQQGTHSLNGDRQPVAMVSFDDAKKYAEWLTAQDREAGRIPADLRYRLPTETEWTAFARCGTEDEFPWGQTWPPAFGNYRGPEAEGRGEKIEGLNDGAVVSCDVEKSGVNRWGLCGVGGNVWEATVFEAAGDDPSTWRGGSWDSGTPGLLRTNFRSEGMPNYRFPNYGFRLVLAPVVKAEETKEVKE